MLAASFENSKLGVNGVQKSNLLRAPRIVAQLISAGCPVPVRRLSYRGELPAGKSRDRILRGEKTYGKYKLLPPRPRDSDGPHRGRTTLVDRWNRGAG